jgi:MFS family permease
MIVLSLGQVSEIVTMFILGGVLARLGWKATMIVGILGHAARFTVFAFFADSMPVVVAVQLLHGICYAFFFATVYIFVDEFFPKDVRASAQGLFNVLILGFGPFVANVLCGELRVEYSTESMADGKKVTALNYPVIFKYSMGAALVGAVMLMLFFHPPTDEAAEPPVATPEEESPPVA